MAVLLEILGTTSTFYYSERQTEKKNLQLSEQESVQTNTHVHLSMCTPEHSYIFK